MDKDKEVGKEAYKREVERINAEGISKANKELMFRFFAYQFGRRNSIRRILKLSQGLRVLSKMLKKNFKTATTEDLQKLVENIELSDYADATKNDFYRLIKQLYRWMNDGERDKRVRFMYGRKGINTKTVLKDILTREEVVKMVEVSPFNRDKTALMLLYELGMRVGELLSMTVDCFTTRANCSYIKLPESKTEPRELPCLISVPYLVSYLEEHPDRENPKAPFWVQVKGENKGKPMNQPSILKMVKTAARNARITKRVYTHLFRHTCATEKASYFTEAQMCKWFGWAIGSGQVGTYTNRNRLDIEETYLKQHGIKPVKKEEDKALMPKICTRCNTENGGVSNWCCQCGAALDIKTVVDADELKKQATEKAMEYLKEILQKPELKRELERLELEEKLKSLS